MKKIIFSVIVSMLALLSAHAYAYNVTLNDIILDYENGVICVSGDIGYLNSGSRVAVKISDSDGVVVYADQATSTAYGMFEMNIKMTSSYKSGEYTVSVYGTDTEAAGVKTFTFDSSKDNYYISNLRIMKNGGKADTAYTDEELSAEFDFFSSFGYGLGEAKYTWQAAGSPDGVWYDLGASGAVFAFTTADAERMYSEHKADFSQKKLYVRVTAEAKTTASADFSPSIISENTVEIITLPVAGQVTAARDGKLLKGNYEYYDFQNKEEKNSKYEWLELSGGEYKAVSEGLTFVLPSITSSRTYKFRVTPRSADGTLGKPTESEDILVSSSAASQGSGSGSGGGGVSAGRPAAAVQAEPVASDEPKTGFTDLPDEHWAKEAIDRLAEKGIVNGMGDGSFAPSREVTRAEFAAMILGCLGAEKSEYDGGFNDVSVDDWYAETVQTASELGLLNGDGGDFRPKDNITREEMAKVLLNVCSVYLKVSENSAKAEFTDFDAVSPWAAEAVSVCAELGLISGMPDGSFAPKESVTRAQAAIVSDKICTMIAEQKGEEE